MTRRTWIYLVPERSCVVWHPRRRSQIQTYSSFEMACARKVVAGKFGRRGDIEAESREERIGREVAARVLPGDVVYAVYSKPTNLVKFGRTTELHARWAKLESGSGMPLQLLSVWPAGIRQSSVFEREMFARFADGRRMGEWFTADTVIPALKADCRAATREQVDRWWMKSYTHLGWRA